MISVIGAGPSGAYAASLLAKHDKVVIFEEHDKIGVPVQCTGITTGYISSLVPVKNEFLLNRVSRVRVFSPSNNFTDFNLKNPNLVLDRAAFDRFMVGRAIDNGAELLRNHRFLNSRRVNNKLVINLRGKYKRATADILIGADGPFSQVAKSNSMFGKRSYVVGIQVRAKVNVEKDRVNFYLNKNFMGWVVPESDKIARVGIALYSAQNFFFRDFVKKVVGKNKILDYQSGFIPIYNPQIKTQKDNVYLVGDAATQVKSSTYGGLIQGLIAAQELFRSCKNNSSYEKLWKKRMGRDLWFGLMIRKKLNRFSDKDYNRLVHMVRKDSIKKTIESYDRDFPSRFMLKLLVQEPRFLRFLV